MKARIMPPWPRPASRAAQPWLPSASFAIGRNLVDDHIQSEVVARAGLEPERQEPRGERVDALLQLGGELRPREQGRYEITHVPANIRERDRQIDDICQMIRTAARTGIPMLKYNMSILGVVSTEPVASRGGAKSRASTGSANAITS